MRQEVAYAAGVETHLSDLFAIGEPTSFACPDCHGALIAVREASPPRFRRHTGHSYTLQSLEMAVREDAERALFGAVRALEEQAQLNDHLSDRAKRIEGDAGKAARYAAEARLARRRSTLVQAARQARNEAPADSEESARIQRLLR